MGVYEVEWADDGHGGAVGRAVVDGRRFVLRCDRRGQPARAWAPHLHVDRGEDGELDLVAPSLDLAVEITLDGAKSRVVGMLDAVVALTSGDAFDVLLALVRRLRGKVAADPYFATPLYLERTGCDQVIEVLAGMGF